MTSRRSASKGLSGSGKVIVNSIENGKTAKRSFETIWDALLNDDPAERERQKVLSDLWIAIESQIKKKGWTQKQAAAQMGVTQPRISDLLRGKLDRFSVDSLVTMAALAGLSIRLETRLHR